MQTYEIVSHITTEQRPKVKDNTFEYLREQKIIYDMKMGMRRHVERVMRQWFSIPDDNAFYAVFVKPGKFNIHGIFRFDPDDLAFATQKLDEIVFKAAEDNGVEISGWISFVPVDIGYEMIPDWKEQI